MPAVIVDRPTFTVTEARTDLTSLRVRPESAPAGPVTITVSRTGDADIQASVTTLHFDTTDWTVPKTLPVTAVADADAADGVAQFTFTDSSDGTTATAAVTERDDDGQQRLELVRGPNGTEVLSGSLREGHTYSLLFRLTAAPVAPMTVTAAFNLGGSKMEFVGPASVTFTAANWDQFRSVTVLAKQDADSLNVRAGVSLTAPGLLTRKFALTVVDDERVKTLTGDVLVDDYVPQAQAGTPDWNFSRLDTIRSQVDPAGDAIFTPLEGSMAVQVGAGGSFAGVTTFLAPPAATPARVNLDAFYPAAILSPYQVRVTGATFEILDGNGVLEAKIERAGQSPTVVTKTLTGGPATVTIPLSADHITDATQITWLITGGPGRSVKMGRVTLQITSPAMAGKEAFVASYAALRANYDAASGAMRDRADLLPGERQNVPATGLLALATVTAADLGVVSLADATALAEQATTTVTNLPKLGGLLPHFLQNGSPIEDGTDHNVFSSVDTAITYLSLLLARQRLGLPTAAVEQAVRDIAWDALRLLDGTLARGYRADTTVNPGGWDVFGGETELVRLLHAAAQPTRALAAMPLHEAKTYNGAGYLDELARLLVPAPRRDEFGNDIAAYRDTAARAQLNLRIDLPGPLAGLSPVELPRLSALAAADGYHAFGAGGVTPADDGSGLLGAPIIAPHYQAMIADRYPNQATAQDDYLAALGIRSPGNVVESVFLREQNGRVVPEWNALRSSLNLAFTVLGTGKALLGEAKYPAYQAAAANRFVRDGLARLTGATVSPAEAVARMVDRYALSARPEDFGRPTYWLSRDYSDGGTFGTFDSVADMTLDGNDADRVAGRSSLKATWTGAGANGYFQFGTGNSVANRPQALGEIGAARTLRFLARGDTDGQQVRVNVFRRTDSPPFYQRTPVSRAVTLTRQWREYAIDLGPAAVTPADLHAVQFVLGDDLPAGNKSFWLDEVRLNADGTEPDPAVNAHEALRTGQPRDTTVFPSQSSTYDAALIIKVLIRHGTTAALDQARKVAKAILDTAPDAANGYPNLRPGGHSLFGDGSPRPAFSAKLLGDQAWFGLALIDLYTATGDPIYLQRAGELSDWAEANLKDTGPLKGYRGGYDADGTAVPWRSTEHAIDMFALESALSRTDARIGDPTAAATHAARRDHAAAFVVAMLDPSGNFFRVGTTTGDAMNTSSIALDVQVWAYLTLGRSANFAAVADWNQVFAWVRANLNRVDGASSGVTYSTASTPNRVWFEGVGQLAVADVLRGETAFYNGALAQLKLASAGRSGVPAASSDTLADPALGAVYDARDSAAATAWFAAATGQFNLFDPVEKTTRFADDFARPDGPSVGPDYTEAAGDFSLVGGQAATGGAALNVLIADATALRDGAVSAAVAVPTDGSAGVLLRYVGGNYYLAQLTRAGAVVRAGIFRNVGGTLTRLQEVVVGSDAGVLKLDAMGSRLELSLNGVPVMTAFDSAITAEGAAGLRGTAGRAFDNFLVTRSAPGTRRFESFATADSPDLGPNFREVSGIWAIAGQQLVASGTAAAFAVHDQIDTADVRVQARVQLGASGTAAGVFARYAAPGDRNYYLGQVRRGGNTFTASIVRNLNGVVLTLASATVTAGVGQLELGVSGDLLRLYYNGALVAAASDAAISGPGLVGVRGIRAKFDDFRADAINSPAEFAEDFSTRQSGPLSAPYTKRFGAWSFANGKLKAGAGSVNVALLGEASGQDVSVSAGAVADTSGSRAGVVVRHTGTGEGTCYRAELVNTGGVITAVIVRVVRGRATTLAAVPWSATNATLELDVIGDSLTLILNGTRMASVTDTAVTGPGLAGVRGTANREFASFGFRKAWA